MCAPKSPVLVLRPGCWKVCPARARARPGFRSWSRRATEVMQRLRSKWLQPWLIHRRSTSVKRLLHRGRRCLEIFREEETTSASAAKPRQLDQLLGATQLKPQRLEPTCTARHPSISLSSVSSRSRHSASRGMHLRVPTSATILRGPLSTFPPRFFPSIHTPFAPQS